MGILGGGIIKRSENDKWKVLILFSRALELYRVVYHILTIQCAIASLSWLPLEHNARPLFFLVSAKSSIVQRLFQIHGITSTQSADWPSRHKQWLHNCFRELILSHGVGISFFRGDGFIPLPLSSCNLCVESSFPAMTYLFPRGSTFLG